MTTSRRLQRSDYSRMWLIQWGAGPANEPQYESQWKAGAVDWSLGDVTNVYDPNPDNYGQFIIAGQIIGEPGNPSLDLTARYKQDAQSLLLLLAQRGCNHELQVHMGFCEDPQDFNRGWQKVGVLENARPTNYGTTELGAMGPDERAIVNEEVPFTGTRWYEIVRIVFGEKAAAQLVQQVIDVEICDRVTCGSCGIPSDGCSVIFALTLSNGGSPGLPAEIVFTDDGGQTFDDTNITTLGANEDPNALACVGIYLVVISEDSESLHYAATADILAGSEAWTEVTTGFVSGKGPLAMISLDPRHTWIVAEGGYIYFTDDPTAGVEVQDAGNVTTQDYSAIAAFDELNLIAVGASNAVAVTRDGGTTWAAVTGPAVGVTLNAVWMHGVDEWFIGTAAGKLWYTRDGGNTWTEKTFPGSGSGVVRDIKFSTNSVGYLAHSTIAPAGRILRTIDGGHSWYVAPEGNFDIPTNDYVKALAICPENPNIVWGGGLAGNGTDGFLTLGAGPIS